MTRTAKALYAANAGAWVEVPLGGTPPPAPVEWTRPTDWLATNVTTGQQKIQLLVHIRNDMTVEVPRTLTVMATPAYIVDWGDGTAAENIATGVTAKHLYDTAALAGTATSEGMLQALVTLTPQASGSFATLNLAQLYYTGTAYWYKTPVVEVVTGPPLSGFVLGAGATNISAVFTKRIEFKSPVTIPTNPYFNGATELREIVGELICPASGSLNGLFSGCSKLTKFPTITVTYAGTVGNASGMFSNCTSMTVVPYFNGANFINFSSMFQGCTSLRDSPTWLDTSRGTDFGNMFNLCSSLVNVTSFDTSKGTSFATMFGACTSLTSVPLFDTALGVNFTSMFNGCIRLVSVPALNIVKGITLTSMFNGCTKLVTLPALNTVAATAMNNMFLNCVNLDTVSLSSTAIVTTFATMFSGCVNLTRLTGFDLAGPTTSAGLTNMFLSCSRLNKIGVLSGKGPRFTHTIAPTLLDAAALNDYYTQLPTVTAQTITVTGVPGTVADDPSIATAKGWTVTGS